MKRRDLIKTGFLAAAAASLSACTKNTPQNDDKSEIIPKQTDIYKFSCPIPYDIPTIDKIAQCNQKYKKSRFQTLYNNIQKPCIQTFNEWLQVGNMHDGDNIKEFKDFAQYAKHALDCGLEVAYLLNSPKPYSEKDFNKFKDELFPLLDNLLSIGVKNIKVGNTQTADIVNAHSKEFMLSSSTAFEFHTVSQYVNLIKTYPNINLIDVAIDENQNFAFLRGLKKLFPKVDLEVMVNEPCIKGCPARSSHVASVMFKEFDCHKLRQGKDAMFYNLKAPAVYPWTLEYYSAIGVNNFKFVIGKGNRGGYKHLDLFTTYMDTVEYGVENYSVRTFFENVIRDQGMYRIPENLKVSEIMEFLPDIRHFVKYGDRCATNCGAECHYCENLAKELENFLNKVVS